MDEPTIWYREELMALCEIVRESIRRPPPDLTDNGRLAQFVLLDKLQRAIASAPGLMAS